MDSDWLKLTQKGSNRPEWAQMVGSNGLKWAQIGPNWTKWAQMGPNGLKLNQMGPNDTIFG